MDAANVPAWELPGESLFQLLTENVRGYALYVVDGARTVRTWSPGAERMLGYSEAEALGQSADRVFAPEGVEAGEPGAEVRRAAESGRSEVERWYVRKDGSRLWADALVTRLPGPGGGVGGYAVILRDRSDWKAMEAALRESEARQAAIVRSALDAVVVFDRDGRVLDFNPAAERTFGYAAAEVLGREAADLVVPPRLREARRRGMALFLETGEGTWLGRRIQTAALRKDGTEFPAEIVVAHVRTEGSTHFVAYVRDLSETAAIDRYRNARLAVAQALEQTGPIDGVIRGVLKAVCESLDWDVGAFWALGPDGASLHRVAGWHSPDVAATEIEAGSRRRTFAPGEGLVGRAWSARRPAWIPDLNGPTDFLRADAARKDGLHAVGEIPVLAGNEIEGVIEIFSRRPSESDAGLLEAMASIGAKVGHYLRRRRAEESLVASERHLRAIIDTAPQCIKLIARDGTVREMNAAGLRFFEATEPEQVVGRSFFALVAAEDLERYRAFHESVCAGREGTLEFDVIGLRGARRTLEATSSPLRHNDSEARVAVSLDVTQRRRDEERLRMRDRAIRAISEGILIADRMGPDNPIIYASPGFEKMTGYGADEALGKNCRFLQGRDTNRETVAEIRRAVAAGRACSVEILNYRKDGTPFWNALSIYPMTDGKSTHFVGVQADVTGRRRLEEQFRQAQKMEAVGQLAGGVAHDFNNLLTIINGYSDLLLQALPPGDSSRELLDEIHKAGVRSAGLTRQLLAFSRQQVLAPRILDLNATVDEAEKLLRRVIGEDVRLVVEKDPALGAVRADPGQLEQVLVNLAVNARDAMPTGGRLTVETRNVEADRTFAGGRVLLAVTDTGCGMTPEVKARIFEPFFTTKGPGKGTGLGLATVFGIVQQSGGTLEVRSEVGVGTTFNVYLPRAEKLGGSGSGTVRSVLRAPPKGSETILLVEDDEGVRVLTRHILSGYGYTVLVAAGGEEAKRVAQRHGGAIRLLITDVVMPGLGGRAVAEQLVALHPGLLVLYVSGYTDDAIVRHGVMHNEVNFLQKPFSPVVLAHKVREILDASP